MKLTTGVWARVFAWWPVRYVERSDDGDYQLKTTWLKPVYVTVVGGNGGAPSLQYKSQDVYEREWLYSILSCVKSDHTAEELKEFLDSNDITVKTHTVQAGITALRDVLGS